MRGTSRNIFRPTRCWAHRHSQTLNTVEPCALSGFAWIGSRPRTIRGPASRRRGRRCGHAGDGPFGWWERCARGDAGAGARTSARCDARRCERGARGGGATPAGPRGAGAPAQGLQLARPWLRRSRKRSGRRVGVHRAGAVALPTLSWAGVWCWSLRKAYSSGQLLLCRALASLAPFAA